MKEAIELQVGSAILLRIFLMKKKGKFIVIYMRCVVFVSHWCEKEKANL
jgi:hypothetical protein